MTGDTVFIVVVGIIFFWACGVRLDRLDQKLDRIIQLLENDNGKEKDL